MMADEIIPTTMKAVVVRDHGDVDEALNWVTDHPVPTLKEGQVLIRNEYAGLNFIDTYYRTGLYKQQLPFISGQEGGGTVVKLGPGVIVNNNNNNDGNNIQVGDRVIYMTFGTYCEYTAVPTNKVIKLPNNDEGISMEQALGGMCQGLTAHYLVTDCTANLIQPDDWCLIYSVGSGTCQLAAQMAKIKGYKVIGTTSKTKSPPKDCCDEVIMLETAGEGKTYADYESIDIYKKVMEITNGVGVKCIIDGVGKNTSDISINCISKRGIWISFGNASGSVPPFSLLKLSPKSAFVTRPTLAAYIGTREELERRINDIFEWTIQGKLNINVDQIFSLEKAQDAHTYLEAGKSKGKILLKV